MRVGPRWVCGSAACSGQLPDERWNIFTLYHKTAGDGRDVYCLVGFMTAYRSSPPPPLPPPPRPPRSRLHIMYSLSAQSDSLLPTGPSRPPPSLAYICLVDWPALITL